MNIKLFTLRRERTRMVSMALAFAFAMLLPMAALAQDDALVARGKVVATEGDCAACHSPNPAKPFAGGMAIGSPMGSIYASNITPSTTHGIGAYTEQQFADALRKGIRADGTHLYPAMPYTAYAGISDADMHALYAYFLHGVAPVDQATPTTKLPFPFNLRWSMTFWNALYLKSGEVKDDPALSPSINRGKYLVDTLGHCSSCHTPRGLLMAEQSDHYLGGAKIDGWIAPNITADAISGIGSWSDDEIAQYLKNGHVKGKGQAAGGMADAVENSLRFLPDNDLLSIAAYLKSVKPIHDAADTKPAYAYEGGEAIPPLTTLEPQRADGNDDPDSLRDVSTTDGAVLYSGACASCHQPSGKGTENQYFPSLSHNRAVGLPTSDNLVMAILHGVNREGADLHVAMPAFGRDMNDAQIASVANYVNLHFGNPAVKTTAADVASIRAGGPKPLLLKMASYAIPMMILFLAVLIWLVYLVIRRRRG